MSIRVSIDAEPITAVAPVNRTADRMVRMGNNTYFHISPEMARQWIGVLETIAAEESSK